MRFVFGLLFCCFFLLSCGCRDKEQRVKVAQPKATIATTSNKSQLFEIVIVLHPEQNPEFNGQSCEWKKMSTDINKFLSGKNKSKCKAIIKPDKTTKFKDVLKVMDILEKAGVTNLSFANLSEQ